ncbi:MAG TPA: glycosyltransferase family 39 protein [Mariprofundaceae bacterium]|nr:glycosyltransferase family 39 protein [Mariprofundaceae bacterium]
MNRLGNIPARHYAWYLAAIWAVLTLPSLGLAPLFDYDETIYAQTAADMMHLGEWIVPTANGTQFFEKPPFTYYMMDACFTLFGENAFAARLPSAIFTLLTALLLFRFGRDIRSPAFGMAAASVFLSMLEVGLLAHAAILDAVLNFFIAACLLNYVRWLQWEEPRHALWCAAMMGAAVSIKGPVGMVVPVLVILADRLVARDLKRTLASIPWGGALLLLFLTATPWYLMILIQQGPGFLYEFIVVHNIGRALNPMQGHGGGWHYYIVVFAVSVLPWLAFMPWLARQWDTASKETMDGLIRLGLLWTLIVIVLFTFAQTKLPHYISCLYPGVALAIAAAWWRCEPDSSRNALLLRATALILLPVALFLTAFPYLYPMIADHVHHPRAVAILAQDIKPGLSISIAGIILIAALIWLCRRSTPRLSLGKVILAGFVLQSALLIPLGSFAGRLAQGPQTRIAEVVRSLPDDVTLFSYNLNFPSISFQSGRSYRMAQNEDGIKAIKAQSGNIAIIMRSESLPQLPWLAAQQPVVDQGGFLLYVLHPQSGSSSK